MFIAILIYKKPLKEIDSYLQEHRDYLAEHDAVDAIIAQAPFKINGIADTSRIGMTATASEITNIPEQLFTVTIKELPDENFGIGGKTIDEIKWNYNSKK